MWEVAVDFIGADVMEAELRLFPGLHRLPVVTGSFQQRVGPDDISLDELCWAIDGAVYMAFSCQVHDCIWFVFGQNSVYLCTVADVDLLETVSVAIVYLSQALKIACIGQLIEVDDLITRVFDDVTNDGRAN